MFFIPVLYEVERLFAGVGDLMPGRSFAMGETSKPRILIADANEANVELIKDYLGGLEAHTEVAVDGLGTLDKAASFNPDLIVLDSELPRLNGFDVCERLKGNPDTAGIMILMVTALNELGDIERTVEAGTNDFLSKPVNKIELNIRIRNLLELH